MVINSSKNRESRLLPICFFSSSGGIKNAPAKAWHNSSLFLSSISSNNRTRWPNSWARVNLFLTLSQFLFTAIAATLLPLKQTPIKFLTSEISVTTIEVSYRKALPYF
ncbi:MAG: hypothetical protein OCD02_03075 [Spirochaetaceae bacterium]